MSLKGNFIKKASQRFQTNVYSFELSCTSLFGETLDCAIFSCNGQLMLKYTGIKMKHGSLLTFNVDTLQGFAEHYNGWCQGDYFAILDKKGKEKQKWVLSIKEYAQGDCPECHGVQRCVYCHGNGQVYSNTYMCYETCRHCGGTGVCPTCYVPKRIINDINIISNPLQSGGIPISGVTYGKGQSIEARKEQQRIQIQQEINVLQNKLQQVNIDLNMIRLKNQELSMRNVYMSYTNLKYQYERQLLELQSTLNSL